MIANRKSIEGSLESSFKPRGYDHGTLKLNCSAQTLNPHKTSDDGITELEYI